MTAVYDPLERAPRDGGEVEVALIECAHLWRRSPGGGRWPFAGDGPWHLVRADPGDYDARGGDMTGEPSVGRVPLSREEMARRDLVSGWYAVIAADADGALVRDAVAQLAGGASRVAWRALTRTHRNRHGGAIGADGLARRYERALDRVARAVRAGWRREFRADAVDSGVL